MKFKEQLKGLSVSHISDALGRTGVPNNIFALNPKLKMCGPAFTIKPYPGDNLTLHYALTKAPANSVLVVDAEGFTKVALWGELMSLSAKAHHIAGIVIDGAVRDSDILSNMDFPVFALGVTPRGPVKATMGKIDVPIQCGGVVVNPGDLVVGDADGLVIVPKDRIEACLTKAKTIAAKEQTLATRVEKGEYLFDILELSKLI